MNFLNGKLITGNSSHLLFDEGCIRIPLPASYQDLLHGYAGKEVVFGIRPEDVHDPETLGPGVQVAEIMARVEVVEPMGSEVFLHLTTGKSSFVARVDPLHMPVVDQEVRLAVEIAKSHFFDKDTQKSLFQRI